MDLIKDKVYKYLYNNDTYIFKFYGSNLAKYICNNKFNTSSWKFWTKEECFQEVANEEIDWLNACISANKFVEKPKKRFESWNLSCDPILLTDLSEIQQYLPLDYVDRIREFRIGDGYSNSYDGRLLKITEILDECAYFEVFDEGHYSPKHNFDLRQARLATQSEIDSVNIHKVFSKPLKQLECYQIETIRIFKKNKKQLRKLPTIY